ncbi:MAG: cytochrome c maturation protein CcmE [Coriobacteriia bacterium]|nr:cytochrome c maturation protein CcmE [Coriobacteriia bacterium]
MNKRARNRLIGVTAIVLLSIVAIFASIGSSGSTAYYKSVEEVATDDELVGERVKLGGAVVTGSWDKKSNPMTFDIRDEADTDGTGAVVKVVYNGPVPSTFGDGVTAIITGELAADGHIEAGEMITKCPSKYESATGAMDVGAIKDGQTLDDVSFSGYVVAGTIAAPGGDARFSVAGSQDAGAKSYKVAWDGALPAGMNDGSMVIIKGGVDAEGLITATDVALEASEKK